MNNLVNIPHVKPSACETKPQFTEYITDIGYSPLHIHNSYVIACLT